MSPLAKKQAIAPSSLDKTAVTPLEKESLKSTELERGISFFGGRYVVRVANRLELRQKVYEYVNKVYLNKGFIKNENSKLRLSIHNALPDTTTLFAEDQNCNLNGTLTIVFDSDIGLPSDIQYKKEIDKLRSDQRQICEFMSLSIDRAQRGSIRILAALFYCSFLLSSHIMASTDIIINVIPSQEDFYCKKLFFRKIGNQKKCLRASGVPAVLMSVPLSIFGNLRKKKRVFPFSMFHNSEQDEIKLAGKLKRMILPMSDLEFHTFFIEKTELWEKASDEQKNYIKKFVSADGFQR